MGACTASEPCALCVAASVARCCSSSSSRRARLAAAAFSHASAGRHESKESARFCVCEASTVTVSTRPGKLRIIAWFVRCASARSPALCDGVVLLIFLRRKVFPPSREQVPFAARRTATRTPLSTTAHPQRLCRTRGEGSSGARGWRSAVVRACWSFRGRPLLEGSVCTPDQIDASKIRVVGLQGTPTLKRFRAGFTTHLPHHVP